jgi:glycosyltransferase involved in cell wall biosynthesis
MKFIYLTAKRYPGGTADHHYIENLAKAMHSELGSDFSLVVFNTEDKVFGDLPVMNLRIPYFIKRTAYFFFWIPFGVMGGSEQTTFFSNDQNLLSILIFWKKILNKKNNIVADWHLLTNTWKDSYIARNADHSITTSKKLEKALRNIAPLARISTIYGGVDLKSFEISQDKLSMKKELGLPTDSFLVGYVGLYKTMNMEKGIGTMIEALSSIQENIKMVFVGGKPQEIVEYENYADKLKVLDKCLFIPIQTFKKVVKYEKAMDVLVIPYPDKPHFRNFGFPMKIYEYMASGVPIIYTKLDLLEEVVSECAYGIRSDSSGELSKIISQIHSRTEEAVPMALKAKEEVKKYSWSSKAQNILKVLI